MTKTYTHEQFVKWGKEGNEKWKKDPRFKEASSRGGKIGSKRRIKAQKEAKKLSTGRAGQGGSMGVN